MSGLFDMPDDGGDLHPAEARYALQDALDNYHARTDATL